MLLFQDGCGNVLLVNENPIIVYGDGLGLRPFWVALADI
jgi:hypothetical protein